MKNILIRIYTLLQIPVTRFKVIKLIKASKPICLDVAAGDIKGKNNWITVDRTRNCDLFWDLRNGIPFPSNSVKEIYCSHFLEHLSFREGQTMLKEFYRVLSKDGRLRVAVPNARLYVDTYLEGGGKKQLITYKDAFNDTTPIDYLNYMGYMNGVHKYMFDIENLIKRISLSGFKNVSERSFEDDIDIKFREFESIYAVAFK